MSKAIGPLPNASAGLVSAWDIPRSVVVVAALIPAMVMAWVLWLAPIPDLAADRTAVAARDFTALWGAGRLAGQNAFATLSDPVLFTQHLRAWFGAGMPDQIWPYPPPILLLAAPLSQLPLGASFLLYSAATLLVLWIVLRVAGLSRLSCTASLLSPAVADNLLIGQNGALTAACLVGGTLLVDARPLVAGALLGALILKPQLAILVPIALVAGKHWRAAASALLVAASFAGLSWVWFGASAWSDYFVTARPAIQAYFEAPWDAAGPQRIFASAFMAARSLGGDLATSYLVQLVVALVCAALVFHVWRRPSPAPLRRMALTVALASLASPWVHSYDMPALAVAIVALVPDIPPEHRPWLALAWFWPGALALTPIPNALLVLSTASIAVLAWRAQHSDTRLRFWKTHRCASSASSS